MTFDEAIRLIDQGVWMTRWDDPRYFVARRKSLPSEWAKDYSRVTEMPPCDYYQMIIDITLHQGCPIIWFGAGNGWEPNDADRQSKWRIYEFPGHEGGGGS